MREPLRIVGAGLVGALQAIYLARRGYAVELFEQRPDLRRGGAGAGKSINLAISARGLHALAQVGLREDALAHATPMRGRTLHALDGSLTFQAYGQQESDHINSISRAWINETLLTAAEATGRVTITFERPFSLSDVDGRVLIGADGGGSAVRQALQAELGDGMSVRQSFLGHGYKELTLPAGPRGAFQLDQRSLHIWPRGTYMLIALPNLDGSFTCTLFLPHEGTPSFASLKSSESLTAFFAERFKDALALLPDLADQFFRNPTGQLGTLKAWPWTHEKTVLIGDAAHAIVPFYGQGMNCGFEDCVVFDRLLAQQPPAEPIESIFETFARARKPQSDAIADMAIDNFAEMRDKTADPRFLLEKAVERRLLTAFPGRFFSRYTLVSFSLAPYRFASDLGMIAGDIVHELCEGLQSAEQVDLTRAERLIADRLAPFLKENRDGFRIEG